MSFRGRGLEPVDEERCRGQGKDQILCNLHRCPFSSISFRSQQCAKFNHIPYQGKYYSWESAENDRPLCALDCKTKERSDISTRMADMVVDGTRCRDDSLDVCISGICTKVGCDLKLDSNKKVDACGVCDGNGTACSDHHAVFIWEETPLSHCSVPCGGGFMMARPICINAKTREHVIDDLCDSTNRPNERMAPCNQKACPARWEVDDWKSCSKPCGRGVKERNVSCIIDENGEKVKVSEKQCLDLKPPSKEGCNTHQCPQWFTGLWSDCSTSCGKGTRHRNVICRDERGLPSGACDYSIRPGVSQVCYTHCEEEDHDNDSLFNHDQDETKTKTKKGSSSESGGNGWIRLDGEVTSHMDVDQDEEENSHVLEEHESSKMVEASSIHPLNSETVSPQPPQELLQVATTDPTGTPAVRTFFACGWLYVSFIVEEWGTCSSPCGEGIRKRKVECKIFLEFSKTIAVLPDNECPGPKPPITEVCYSGLCNRDTSSINNIQMDIGDPSSARRSTYSWKDAGFTSCSESCLGGIQESKIICVEDELETPVAPNNCPIDSRPEIIVRTCNDHPCPPRWNVSEFSKCSKSCGGGIQIRSVSCIQEVRHGGNNILKVNDSLCPQPPPITQQFCNVLDCPIKWTTSDWTKCSSSCGGGYKFRKVRCQQLLALGEMADKPDMQCPGRKPEEQRLCNSQNCPEVTGIYSKFHYEKDHLDSNVKNHHTHHKLEKEVRMPSIKANFNQNYIQTDPTKKTVKLKVGGKASVYVGTKLKIRCPVKKFDRKKIQWSHENSLIKPLIHKSKQEKRTTNVFVTKKGGLRIKKINYSDAGVYTCLAKGSTATIELIVQRLPDDYSNDSIKWKKYGNAVNGSKFSSKDGYYNKYGTTWDPHKLWVSDTTTEFPSQPASDNKNSNNNLYMRFNTVENRNEKSWNLVAPNKEESDYYDWESNANTQQEKQNSYTNALDQKSAFTPSSSSPSSSVSLHLISLIILILLSQLYFNRRKQLSSLDYVDDPEYEDNTEIKGKDREGSLKLQWQTTEWTPCSQTCGIGGSQLRKIRCVVIQGNNATEIPKDICVDSGLSSSKPDSFRKCIHNSPCPKWLADPWPACLQSSKCISRGRGLQLRQVRCGYLSNEEKNKKDNNLDDRFCEAILRPKASRQCNNPKCEGKWHVGSWSECSTPCGNNGTRIRTVKCRWKNELEVPTESIEDSSCETSMPKPSSSEPCNHNMACNKVSQTSSNVSSFSSHINDTRTIPEDCHDESQYCGLVYSFKLCNLPKYKDKCCYSCSIVIHK
ncbi:protein madd-4 isoform X1 [Lepeophtheirus salmonis]|uniref:protein madd-4 isoform X1 n=1 Tax=Lepeophtheirus salmonis TaxID=72036 RepID=UPI003AF381D6